MSVGKDKGTKWGKKRGPSSGGMTGNIPKNRTKAKAQPRLKGYKKRKKR